MAVLPKFRAAVALLLVACLLCPPARALVSFNDGKEHIYVTGTASVGHDSNLYAHAGSAGDTIYSAGILVEYERRAGWIGVNGSVGLDLSQFVDNRDENFANPRFSLEFVKSGGRTTGGLSLSAARENQADSAANLRAQSWNYTADLNLKYPVISRYSIAGDLGYTSRVYDASSGLSNLRTYTIGTDLLYALDSERNLFAGYRYRLSDTSTDTMYDDHSFTVGVSGQILPRLTGSLRAGYQIRRPHGQTTDGDYRGLTASGTVNFTATKKFSVGAQVSRDLSVTSTDVWVDTTSGSLNAQYVFNAKISVFANVGGGTTRFLSLASQDRRDQFFTFGGGVNYTIMQHLKATLAYTYFQNWSNFDYADYDRNSLTLSLTSRW